MIEMYSKLKPLLFQLDPETAHRLAVKTGMLGTRFSGFRKALEALYMPSIEIKLAQSLMGETFSHPIGLAAGFDKNATLWPLMHALGFSWVEIGSVTALPSQGNPSPRLFRLPDDEALINRMGLNNDGCEIIAPRLSQISGPLGISLAKTHSPEILGEAALEDFAASYRSIYGLGTYVAINISCPNTAEGKTFEEPEAFEALLIRLGQQDSTLQAEKSGLTRKPWLVKISPDLSVHQLAELVAIGRNHEVQGWIVGNTSLNRSNLKTFSQTLDVIGRGGLSGAPIRSRATETLANLYGLTRDQPGMILMGVGGIQDVETAWEKISHGADLLQIYTGLVYQGPGLVKKIHAGLLQKLESESYLTVSQAVGCALK